MPILHSREYDYAFTLNKQSDIRNRIAPGNLTRKLPCRTFSPFTKETPDAVSDRGWYGKGHSHPTFWDPITRRYVMANREFSMTQLSALFAPAFVLGGLSTSQNDSGTGTVYNHRFTFQDPSTNKECLYTTIIEKAGDEYQNLYSGVAINSFSLTGNRNDHVVLGYEGFARDKRLDSTTMPALAIGQSFFKILKSTFTFGASGSPSNITNISADVLSFGLTVSQNAQPFWMPGNASGEENLITKALIGDQTVSGSLVCFLDSARRNLFHDDDECELTIVLTGDQIGSTGLNFEVKITILHFKISSESFGEEGQTTAYTMTFDENSVLKANNDDFVSFEVQTNEDANQLLVAA